MIKFKVSLAKNADSKKLVNDSMKRVLMKSMFKMEELAVDKAPFDRGLLRERISLFPQLLAEKYVLTSRAPYSAAMEYGSRPFWAPIKPLKKWASRKLGDEGVAYAVRAKIAAEGITAHPFMRPALDEVKAYWLPAYSKESLKQEI